jgi:hypothetical protein
MSESEYFYQGHVGQYAMPDGEWECDDDCPHPDHADTENER